MQITSVRFTSTPADRAKKFQEARAREAAVVAQRDKAFDVFQQALPQDLQDKLKFDKRFTLVPVPGYIDVKDEQILKQVYDVAQKAGMTNLKPIQNRQFEGTFNGVDFVVQVPAKASREDLLG